jgi:hypothetical protein
MTNSLKDRFNHIENRFTETHAWWWQQLHLNLEKTY